MSGNVIRIGSGRWIDDAVSQVSEEVNRLNDALVFQMQYIGEKAVSIARDNGNYNNITGNLRSSIGYVVLKNGEPIRYGNPVVYGSDTVEGIDGNEGAAVAQELLDKLKGEYTEGIVLVVCAGMNYASYVEDIYGKDVLTSSRLETEQLAERLIRQLLN